MVCLSVALTSYNPRYPGCKCDIPAHNYAYSFAPNPAWPNYYATSEQIHEYMHSVADKYDCNKYIKYQHTIKSAVWNEEKAKWKIEVEHNGTVFTDEVDVFINAGGVLKLVSHLSRSCHRLMANLESLIATGSGQTLRVLIHSRASLYTRPGGIRSTISQGKGWQTLGLALLVSKSSHS